VIIDWKIDDGTIVFGHVNSACAEFLRTQLDSSNCIDIKAFADFHNCTKFMSSSETFINEQFLCDNTSPNSLYLLIYII